MAVTAPPRRMPPAAFARPAPLPPRPHTWAAEFAISAGAAAGFAVGAPAMGANSTSTAVGTAGLAAVAAGIGIVEFRRRMRGLDVDRAIEQLAPVVGVPPSRALVKATRWSAKGWPGRPGRVVVRYPSAGAVLDPDAIVRITEVLSGQPWGEYELQKLHRRRNMAVFVPAESDEAETSERGEEIARAKRYVLAALGPTALVTKVDVDKDTGALTGIELKHEISHKLAPSGYRARLERVVSAVLPGRWRARFDLEKDWVRFELRPVLDTKIVLPIPDHDVEVPYEDVVIPYAVDEDGNVMVWRPMIDPHMLLIGGTGTGKTSTVHNVVNTVTAMGWMTWVVDGKGIEFLGFRDWPNVQIVGSRLEHQIAIIARAKQEMEERYKLIEAGASESDFQPMLLILDEFADFKGNLLNWYSTVRNNKAGDPTQPRVMQDVASLARKGRSARIHLLFATQRPDADFFGGRGMGDMRDNFRMRVSMGPLSPQGAQMLWESPVVGTTIPRGLRGRATTVNDDNYPVEVQCYYTPDPRKTPPGSEDYELLEKLRPPKVTHERLVILEPDITEWETADEEDTPFSVFNWWMNAPWGWAKDHPDQDPVLLRDTRGTAPVAALVGLEQFLNPGRIPNLEADGLLAGGGDGATVELDADRADRSMAALLTAAGLQSPPRQAEGRHVDGPRRPPLPRPVLTLVQGLAGADDDTEEELGAAGEVTEDDWLGYGPPEPVGPMELMIGDLVCIDDAHDDWAIVDCDPAEDEFDDSGQGLISVSYRGLGDVEGLHVVPPDSEVLVRRPTDL